MGMKPEPAPWLAGPEAAAGEFVAAQAAAGSDVRSCSILGGRPLPLAGLAELDASNGGQDYQRPEWRGSKEKNLNYDAE